MARGLCITIMGSSGMRVLGLMIKEMGLGLSFLMRKANRAASSIKAVSRMGSLMGWGQFTGTTLRIRFSMKEVGKLGITMGMVYFTSLSGVVSAKRRALGEPGLNGLDMMGVGK